MDREPPGGAGRGQRRRAYSSGIPHAQAAIHAGARRRSRWRRRQQQRQRRRRRGGFMVHDKGFMIWLMWIPVLGFRV